MEMKKINLILGLLGGVLGMNHNITAQNEAYPSLGYFPDFKVPVEYEVQAGEYLGKIAKKFKISTDDLKKANLKLAMTDGLKLGDKIKVYPPKVAGLTAPAGTIQYTDNSAANNAQEEAKTTDETKKSAQFIEYTVQKGDTLYGLGKKFKIDPEKIRRANLVLAMTDHVEPGQVIKIPVVQ